MNAEVTKVLLEMAESLKRLADCIGKTDEPKKDEAVVTLEQVRGVLA